MQRFSQRESVLLGYSPQKTFMVSSSASEDVDVDFNDVFGGPPRRTSIQESRYSFGENRMDSSAFKRSDESVRSSRNPWSEKPVFGDEGLSSRRRHSRNDFFDDIFKGNESLSSSPRKYEMKDPFAPGSQLLSPVRPLPPKAEPFGSSFPAQFSLPAKLNRGMDLPTFGSPTRSSYKSKGSSSNGSNYYTFSPLSRFSGQANQGEEEVTNDFQSSYRFGALSQDLSTGIEDSKNMTAYDGNETRANPKDDSNGSHFHFSIYKWADRGSVQLPVPLRGSERFKEKDELQRCSSANGWIACETHVAMEPIPNLHGSFRFTDKMSRNGSKSFRVHEKNENGSLIDSRNGGGEPENNPMSESEVIKDLKSTENNGSADIVSHSSGNEGKTHRTVPHIDSRDEQEKEVPASGKETKKPLSLFFDDDEQGNDQKPRHSGTKETPKKNAKKFSEILDSKSIKKQDVKRGATPNNVEAIKTSVKGSPRNSWDNGKGRVKGKVKDFIKIFNQDAPSKPQTDAVSESHNSKQKQRDSIKPEKEPSINMTRKEEKNHKANLQKKKKSSDIPVANDIPKGASEKKINGSINDTVSDSSKIIVEDPAESLDDNFSIKDLTLEEKTFPQVGIDLEEIEAIDAKIRQWSNGKQGNIRSLLSTLQYVLWPDSGWKPVPLVDIIEGPSVKRSYQKALLCLHPDKLQQKGAASDKKYIAEKVFDILQDAWTHFSSLGAG